MRSCCSQEQQGKEVVQEVLSLIQYEVKESSANDSHGLFELTWLALC